MNIANSFSIAKRLFWVSRPVSWLNTAYPFAAGYLVAGGSLDLRFFIATIYFLGPYNLLLYGVNDVFDYESDIRNPRKGGIEGMREQKQFHPTILWAAVITNVPFLIWLFFHSTVLGSVALLILLFFVVAYSLVKLRFKERPLLDSFTSSTHFVGPLVYALTLTTFSHEAWIYIIAFFLWGMASHAFGAIQDIIPDRQGKLSSIATVFGATNTIWLCLCLYVAASVLLTVNGFPGAIVGIVGLIYVFNILPYRHIADGSAYKTNKGWRRFIWLNLCMGFVVTMVLIYIVTTR